MPIRIDPRYVEVLKPWQIQAGTAKIAVDLDSFKPEVVVGIMTGCVPFVTDLTRELAYHGSFPLIRFVTLERKPIARPAFGSAGMMMTRGYMVKEKHWPLEKEEMLGKRILLVDDVLDSGETLKHTIAVMYELYNAAAVVTAVAVDKRISTLKADHALLSGEGRWLIGYGMDDAAGLYRNLPGIYADTRPEQEG